MKQKRAAVVAESSPRFKDLGGLRASERTECWESLEKTRRELINTGDLGLLRHYLNDEHFIRRTPFADLEGTSVQLVPGE
jgi:hypothetical protein